MIVLEFVSLPSCTSKFSCMTKHTLLFKFILSQSVVFFKGFTCSHELIRYNTIKKLHKNIVSRFISFIILHFTISIMILFIFHSYTFTDYQRLQVRMKTLVYHKITMNNYFFI